MNKVIKELTEKFKIKHHMSTPYRSQTNGLVERFNKSLCDSLVKLLEEAADWDLLINSALFAHRTAVNRSTQLSPFVIIFGIESQYLGDTVAIKRNATTHFLTLKAYNSLTTYARTIILYLF